MSSSNIRIQRAYLLEMKFSQEVSEAEDFHRSLPDRLHTANGSGAAPYVKAALRDVKSYRDSKNYRKIPVGYSAGKCAAHCH